MDRFLIIPFKFYETSYSSVIMRKPQVGCTEYRITVMNGELEKLLFGNNVIKEIDGSLHLETSSNKMQERLKMEIAKSLGKVLKIQLTEISLAEMGE